MNHPRTFFKIFSSLFQENFGYLYRIILAIYIIRNMKQGKTKAKSAPLPNAADAKSLHKLQISLSIIVALFAFILYIQSVGNDFALDDMSLIKDNKLTTQGFAGIPTILHTDILYGYKDEFRIPNYRPTTLIIFAAVWQFFPNNPHVLHFITVMFFALTCFILFRVLTQLFKNQNLIFPFVGTLLYAAHPLHSEVVYNIKSLDEILCLLFGLLSIHFILKNISTKKITSLIWGCLWLFLSQLTKETGITFLILIPLIIYFFTDTSVKKSLSLMIPLGASTLLFLAIRTLVLKDLPIHTDVSTNVLNNTLYGAPDFISREATAIYVLMRYVFLLIFPHPLTSDYNFSQIKICTFSSPVALLGIVIYGGMLVFTLLSIKKRKNILAFSILFYLISLAPVSNIFLVIGATMAERFLFIPSLGFCLILTYFLIKITKTESVKSKFKTLSQFFSVNTLLFTLVFIIIGLYSIKTFSRGKDWQNNLTLFASAVQISPNSATANRIYGNSLFEKVKNSTNHQTQLDTFNLAKRYLLRSIQIYPEIYAASTTLGNIYYIEGPTDSALYYYERDLAQRKDDVDLNYNVGITLNKMDRNAEAIKVLLHTVALNPQHEDAYYYLAASYTNLNDFQNGYTYFSKVVALNPKRAEAYYYLGLISKELGNPSKSKEYLDKAAALGYAPK